MLHIARIRQIRKAHTRPCKYGWRYGFHRRAIIYRYVYAMEGTPETHPTYSCTETFWWTCNVGIIGLFGGQDS